MRGKDLYAQMLGIESRWQVSSVGLALPEGEVTVHVEQKKGTKQCYPACGRVSSGYDSRTRKWRHLDTCQYKTILMADVPRTKCKEHGVVTVSAPWAEPGSGFTTMLEALVIDWLKEASKAAISRLMGLSWNAMTTSPSLTRKQEPCYLRTKIVKRPTLKAWHESLADEQPEAIQRIFMDMWPAFINATRESLPGADEKIAFGKFHVAKHLGEAVDKVRRQEHKAR